MKFQVTLKDPDALYEAISDALKGLKIEGVSEKELEAIKEVRREEVTEIASKWFFSCHEYITVEIDTDAKTCIVLPAQE